MSLGYIPPVERLRLTPRRPLPWASAPWADPLSDTTTITTTRASRRGLVLDLDDTLYPRERFVRSGFAAVARHVAMHQGVAAEAAFGVLLRARASGQAGQELQALCARFELSSDHVPALLDVYRRHMPALWLNHGVAGVLHQLRSAGWRLGVLTNGLPSVQFRKVAALGLSQLVDEVIYAEEHVAGGKPAGAAFRAVLRSLDLAPGQCVCVGDDVVRDVRGARAAGLRTIRVARPGVTPAPGDEADIVIETFAQLPDAAAALLEMATAHVA